MNKEVNNVGNISALEERKERGATMIEYALLVALIAVVAISAVTFLGEQVSTKFSSVGNSLATSGAS